MPLSDFVKIIFFFENLHFLCVVSAWNCAYNLLTKRNNSTNYFYIIVVQNTIQLVMRSNGRRHHDVYK